MQLELELEDELEAQFELVGVTDTDVPLVQI